YSAAYLDVLVLTSLSHPLCFALIFPFNDTATTEIYTLSLHDALPILLNNIFYKSKVLSDDERSEIRDLMGNVESDQAWGISASSDNFALKNGWLNYGKDEWIVNSIGYVKNSNGTDYTIAVYTDKNQSMAAGQQVIEQLARVTKPILD